MFFVWDVINGKGTIFINCNTHTNHTHMSCKMSNFIYVYFNAFIIIVICCN